MKGRVFKSKVYRVLSYLQKKTSAARVLGRNSGIGSITSILIAHTQSCSRPRILFHLYFQPSFQSFFIDQEFLGYIQRTLKKKKKKNQGNLIVERNLQQAKESIGMKFTMAQSVQPRKDETEVVPFSYSHTYG